MQVLESLPNCYVNSLKCRADMDYYQLLSHAETAQATFNLP